MNAALAVKDAQLAVSPSMRFELAFMPATATYFNCDLNKVLAYWQ